MNPDETFTLEFDKEKSKYLNENIAKIKKERSVAYKLLAIDRRSNASASSKSTSSSAFNSPKSTAGQTKSISDENVKVESTN